MMMAALVCFFGKNNALQPFPVYYFFVILVSFAFSRSVGSVFFVQPLTTCFASCFTFYSDNASGRLLISTTGGLSRKGWFEHRNVPAGLGAVSYASFRFCSGA